MAEYLPPTEAELQQAQSDYEGNRLKLLEQKVLELRVTAFDPKAEEVCVDLWDQSKAYSRRVEVLRQYAQQQERSSRPWWKTAWIGLVAVTAPLWVVPAVIVTTYIALGGALLLLLRALGRRLLRSITRRSR